jgi:hypothetical protein
MMKLTLSVLTYLGIIWSGIVTIWGLKHELYTKDDHKRHLTKAGKYSIVLTLLGLVISLNSAVLKTITDNQDKATARDAEQQQIQKKSLEELQRFNALLLNINRGQYPIGNSISMNLGFRLSIESPLLKKHASRIQRGANDLLAVVQERKATFPREANQSWWNWALDQNLGNLGIGIEKDGSIRNEIDIIDPSSSLLPQNDFPAEQFISTQTFDLSIFDKNEVSLNPPLDKVDLVLASYPAFPFTSAEGRALLRYLRDTREYEIFGPLLPQSVQSNNGRLISYLDLPGTTLLIRCPHGGPEPGCADVTIEAINLYTPVGSILRLEKGSFEHKMIGGEDVLVHRFESNREMFFEHYRPK